MVITGGAGFVGLSLGKEAAARGATVTLFDIRPPALGGDALPAGIRFTQGDLLCYEDVEAACHGASCCFHVASYGMSGVEMLDGPKTQAVNVQVIGWAVGLGAGLAAWHMVVSGG